MPAVLVRYRAHCYTELTVSSPAAAETTACTHWAYPQRDGQAEWAWTNTRMVQAPNWLIGV